MVDITDLYRQAFVQQNLPQMGAFQNASYDPSAGSPVPQQASPVMQIAAAAQPQAAAYAPTSGSQMEADSRNSIDSLLARMQNSQEANHQNDRNMQWMSFFSKLASSKSPTLLGSLGEGAQALTDTAGQQAQSNRLIDRAAMEDQLKAEEFKQELAQKQQVIDQGKYTITADGLGGFIKTNTKTGETQSVNNPVNNPSVTATTADGKPLTGEDYLKTLDPRIGRTAKMVANGDMPWPGGFALKSPYWQNVIAAARTYDPTANGNRFPAVAKFNTGKQGDQVRAFDVGLSHLNTLSTLTDALNNNDTQLLNSAANTWKSQTGQPAPTEFNAAKEVVGNEIVKAIVGAGGGVGDREKAQKALDAANSPAQLKGVISTYKTLMNGQLSGLQQQYENSTGRKDFATRLTPSSQKELAGMSKSAPASNDSTSYGHLSDADILKALGQ